MAEELLDRAARGRLREIFNVSDREQRAYIDTANCVIQPPGPAVTIPEPKEEALADLIESCFYTKRVLHRPEGYTVRFLLNTQEDPAHHGEKPLRTPIPDDDLEIIEGIYHGTLPDSGRKRGTLMRYINFFKDQIPEKTDFFSTLKRQLERS